MGGFDVGQPNDYGKEALAKALDRYVPVVFYFGKTDMACDYVGGHAMAESLNWHGMGGFKSAELQELLIAAAPAAQIQQFGTLTWIQVDSAGHMVCACTCGVIGRGFSRKGCEQRGVAERGLIDRAGRGQGVGCMSYLLQGPKKTHREHSVIPAA